MGPLSTYQQHVRYLAEKDCTDTPKNRFLTDLKMAIKQWQTDGDIVMVLADMNEDVRSPLIKNMFREVGMAEVITSQHQRPPETHNRGSHPIDGIFIPLSLLDKCQTGYLGFGEALPSDHRALWIDVDAQSICPLEPEAIERPVAQWLQCRDPRIIEKYNTSLWEVLQRDGIAERAQKLAIMVKNHLLKAQKEEYKKIDKAATEYKRYAEKQCRKIRAGNVPWCPQVSKAINRILYWKGLQNRLSGWKIGSSVIK